jgi:hypothetical protein
VEILLEEKRERKVQLKPSLKGGKAEKERKKIGITKITDNAFFDLSKLIEKEATISIIEDEKLKTKRHIKR